MELADIRIAELEAGDEEAVAELVMSVFMAHVGHEYSNAGVAEFAKYADSQAIRGRIDDGTSTVLVARTGDRIAGIVEFRGSDHVALMFVHDDYQRRGIARALFDAMVKRHGELGEITVNSSRYAIPVYERLGFVATGAEATVNGITFTPMRRTGD